MLSSMALCQLLVNGMNDYSFHWTAMGNYLKPIALQCNDVVASDSIIRVRGSAKHHVGRPMAVRLVAMVLLLWFPSPAPTRLLPHDGGVSEGVQFLKVMVRIVAADCMNASPFNWWCKQHFASAEAAPAAQPLRLAAQASLTVADGGLVRASGGS